MRPRSAHSSSQFGTVQPKPPFGNRTTYTCGLAHGTTVSAASAILAEGRIRPADWQHHDDPSMESQLPTFGLFSMGQQISRNDAEIPEWTEKNLLDSALKRGKGQQPSTAHFDRLHLQRQYPACLSSSWRQ